MAGKKAAKQGPDLAVLAVPIKRHLPKRISKSGRTVAEATDKADFITQRYEMVRAEELRPHPRNPRKGNVAMIGDLIMENGFFGAVVAQRSTGHILAGNHRYLAFKEQGAEVIPTIWVDVDDERALKILLSDNRASDLGSYDENELAELLQSLNGGLPATGYDQSALDSLLADIAKQSPERDADPKIDQAEELRAKWGTERGQLWEIGRHRLLCGDATCEADVARLLGGEKFQMGMTSPPYNVDVEYSSTSDKKSRSEYFQWVRTVFDVIVKWMQPGCVFAWNVGGVESSRPWDHVVQAESAGLSCIRHLVWKKCGVPLPKWHVTQKNPVARMFTPNPVHEFIFLFSNGDVVYGDRVDVDDTLQHDVFEIQQSLATVDLGPGASLTGSRQSQGLKSRAAKSHPAPFPVRLPKALVNHLSGKNEVVYDPFLGSGTTMVAAENLGRRCFGMEIDPGYCAVILDRMKDIGVEGKVLDAALH